MKIVLLGYMASGKSAIGKLLAEKLTIQFIDLDNFIEENEQMTIPEIFSNKGEVYFRKVESVSLKKLLNLKSVILSLGGGTPCYGNNMDLIKNMARSFYLKASINTIFERIKNETAQRPLVADIGEENLIEFIAKHLFERNPFYEKADYTISVNQKSIPQITDEIIELL